MKKIIINIILSISIFFSCIVIVDAKKYKCYYDFKFPDGGACNSSHEETEYFIVDEEAKTIDTEFVQINDRFDMADDLIDPTWTDERLIKDYLNGKCPDQLNACPAFNGQDTTYMIIINHNLLEKVKKGTTFGDFPRYKWEGSCEIGELNEEKSEAGPIKLDIDCNKYDELYGKEGDSKDKETMKNLYCEIGNENCNSEKLNKYNNKRNQLINYCNTVLSYQNASNTCSKRCLKIKEDIANIEGEESAETICNLSDNLLNWIRNILKWIKYILPIVVIILGILDFIKAIASGSDDEMKKAQGRFIKRLVAAALFFLIPLVIEFVFNIFNIGENPFCGLLD